MGTSDKGRHLAQDIKGKVKEGVGSVTGDEQLEASGKKDQAAAAVKKTGEQVKDAASDAAGGVSEAIGQAADTVGEKVEDARRRSED